MVELVWNCMQNCMQTSAHIVFIPDMGSGSLMSKLTRSNQTFCGDPPLRV